MMYKSIGFLFVGLATLGVVLPVLPTTPFLLVAAGCFSKSSDRWHRWLLESPLFGKLIRDWQDNRSIGRSAKTLALCSLVFFGGYSIGFAITNLYLRIFTGALMLYAFVFIVRMKVRKH